jgi:hypothetical protein
MKSEIILICFFSTVADKIGIDVVYDSSKHPSIKAILNNRERVPDFEKSVHCSGTYGSF